MVVVAFANKAMPWMSSDSTFLLGKVVHRDILQSVLLCTQQGACPLTQFPRTWVGCCAGVLSQAARQVTQQLEALRPQLEGLAAGHCTGDWEGAKELVAAAADALRHVR